jgi:hypothetical protein
MANSQKNKGDEGEREVQALLRDLLGRPNIRRALGAGRKDDVGDIDGVPQTAVQVAWWGKWTEAINIKLPDVERQRKNKRVRFAVVFIRRSRNAIPWIVVQTPEQWCKMHRYAMMGVEYERAQRRRREGSTKGGDPS